MVGVELEATLPETASCGAVTQKPSSISNEEVVSMVEKLMEKIDRLEAKQHQQERGWGSWGFGVRTRPMGLHLDCPIDAILVYAGRAGGVVTSLSSATPRGHSRKTRYPLHSEPSAGGNGPA